MDWMLHVKVFYLVFVGDSINKNQWMSNCDDPINHSIKKIELLELTQFKNTLSIGLMLISSSLESDSLCIFIICINLFFLSKCTLIFKYEERIRRKAQRQRVHQSSFFYADETFLK